MKTYLKVIAIAILLLLAFLMTVSFCLLFFYEGPFTIQAVGIQGGIQFLLFNGLYFVYRTIFRLFDSL